nr:acylsugar acyltransferase 3-like [Tanacetum cinerariifolium]
MVNMRKRLGTNFPELAAGNIFTQVSIKMMNSGQIKLTDVISNMWKGITKLHGLRNAEEVGENRENMLLTLGNDQSH